MSRESGILQLYVTSFPKGVGKWQISSENTQPAPAWRGDGKEIYFASSEGNLMVASIRESAESMVVEGVRPLYRSPFYNTRTRASFDVDPKMASAFIGSAAPDTNSLALNVITNWALPSWGRNEPRDRGHAQPANSTIDRGKQSSRRGIAGRTSVPGHSQPGFDNSPRSKAV
jgi:hypothetical protein